MLINDYSQKGNQTLNNKYLTKDAPLNQTYHSIQYPTTSLVVFSNTTIEELTTLLNEQKILLTNTLKIQEEYNLISKKSIQETLKQYDHFFFYDHHAYIKQDVIRYINQQTSTTNIKQTVKKATIDYYQNEIQNDNHNTITQQPNEPNDHQEEDEPRQSNPSHALYKISRKDIRNITKYTFNPPPPWDKQAPNVFIRWQQQALEDKSDRLVIDGSRQMGKSLLMAELLTEESFQQGDVLVVAPQQSTTDVIKDYMLFYTQDFPDNTFVYKERKKYIENTITGTRIHFRTLEDGAKNIRGMTIRLVVVDEAQLAQRQIIEEVVEPTTTTTGGRMIFIGTALEDLSSYMYHIIDEVETQSNSSSFNTPDTFSAKVIRISADENPMIHPKNRSAIESRKHLPTIQREYYNRWGKLDDALFNPKTIPSTEIPRLIPLHLLDEAIPVLGIDPARTSDRSGYSLSLTHNNVTITYESGFVPSQYKNNWIEQAKFFVALQTRIKETFPNNKLYTILDKTGVGDAVAPIFKQHGVQLTHLIQYTAGTTTTKEYDKNTNDTVLKVGKSALINNYLNYCSSPRYAIVKESNSFLINEIRHIQLTETTQGNIAIKSKDNHNDDITNATMTATFLITQEKLQADYRFQQSTSNNASNNLFSQEIKDSTPKINPKFFQQTKQTNTFL